MSAAAAAATLRWNPLSASDLSKVVRLETPAAEGAAASTSTRRNPRSMSHVPCLFDVAAPKSSDLELIHELEASSGVGAPPFEAPGLA